MFQVESENFFHVFWQASEKHVETPVERSMSYGEGQQRSTGKYFFPRNRPRFFRRSIFLQKSFFFWRDPWAIARVISCVNVESYAPETSDSAEPVENGRPAPLVSDNTGQGDSENISDLTASE